jgi:HSP20 family protein
MDIDFKKLAPWNWFKKEQEEQQSTASLPVQRNDLPVAGGPVSPILQLHREIDRLFDDAFRGFGFPTLAMPRWPSDWPGMLKPALDIQETDKQYKIALEVPGVEEKTSRSRSTTTCCWCAVKSVRSRKRKTAVSTGWSAPTAAFSAL